MAKPGNISEISIEERILTIRGTRVILDADLAAIYGISTKRLNEQVKRNRKRFPADFSFILNASEKSKVVADCDHLSRIRFAHVPPRVFTEHGALMAANVLNSPRAIEMSVFVIRSFVKMRERLALTASLEKRLAEIETTLMSHDVALREIFRKIKPLLLAPTDPEKPVRRIGFTARENSAPYRTR